MGETHALEAWLLRDQEFERKFKTSDSLNLRHIIGRLFRKNKPLSLNEYRDHLLAGHIIGALPTQNSISTPSSLEKLAAKNHDLHVATLEANELQTVFYRRHIQKLIMDIQAGKLPILETRNSDEVVMN